uniref:Uncharacterized protein n=1 Tax=Pristionchus pacificus TaxID=54126 RepID=A0A2A6CUV3_PRIPA|eukprot:PDM81939.1 hypothetical protein PRIPAC_34093 [Pristionchus pacificus]
MKDGHSSLYPVIPSPLPFNTSRGRCLVPAQNLPTPTLLRQSVEKEWYQQHTDQDFAYGEKKARKSNKE